MPRGTRTTGFTDSTKSKDSPSKDRLSALLNKLAHSAMLAWSLFVFIFIIAQSPSIISVIASGIQKVDWEEEDPLLSLTVSPTLTERTFIILLAASSAECFVDEEALTEKLPFLIALHYGAGYHTASKEGWVSPCSEKDVMHWDRWDIGTRKRHRVRSTSGVVRGLTRKVEPCTDWAAHLLESGDLGYTMFASTGKESGE